MVAGRVDPLLLNPLRARRGMVQIVAMLVAAANPGETARLAGAWALLGQLD